MIKNDLNPNWNEELTLAVPDPPVPLKLVSGIFFYMYKIYIIQSTLSLVLSQRCLIGSFFYVHNSSVA